MGLAEEYYHQQGSIDLLIGADLFNEMLRPDRRTRLAITQFCKSHLLAGNSLVEIQPPLHSMTISLNFCSEKTTVWSIIKTLQGSGTRGTIHRDKGATSL